MGFAAWRRLLETYLLPHRGRVVALGGLLLATIAMQVATPQIVRIFIDRVSRPDASPLALLTALYVGAVVLQQGCRIVAVWLGEVVGWLTTNELRADLMAHCLALDPSFHATHPPGELIERVDGDVNGLSMFFSQFLLSVVGNVLLLVGVLVVVTAQNPFAGATLTVFALLALAVIVALRRVAAPAWEEAREQSARLYGYLEERLAGTQDIRSSAAEAHTLRGFYERARDRLWATSHARVMDAWPWSGNAVITFGAHTLAFAIPAVLMRRGELTIGGAFVLSFYAQLLVQPLANMGHQVEQLQQAIAGGRRVVALLGMTSAIEDGPGTVLPPGALTVAFGHVTFGYGDDPDVLHDVSIDVPAGELLGVVGRTGSGKSSLARLAVRLHDVRAGTVTLGGVDVRELVRAELRARVALVTQEVHVLQATVRDNLTLFDPSVPDDRILEAIDQLSLGSWFASLPGGLDAVVGEGGAGMSAGEAQLLSFGRAFLTEPSVVLLDEASSRLDPATEVILERAVDALLAGRTGIVIAHRLSTLSRCDRICVLDGGRVVEHGPRQELADDPSSRFGALLRTGLDVVPG